MHTEEIRARRAARKFRLQVADATGTDTKSADQFLSAADHLTGFNRAVLPAKDPILAGAHALLDRDFKTIWLSAERPVLTQYVDAAHEYGHLILHGQHGGFEEGPFIESVSGYSKNQRDERDAHLFAAEFLLPLDCARDLFLGGMNAGEIAQTVSIPRRLVVRQLIAAFSSTDLCRFAPDTDAPKLDSWQTAATLSSGPALVIGGPGTGKTTCLLARCAHLIGNDDVQASQVLIVADSKYSAHTIRRDLLFSRQSECALAPVTTVTQLAYDLLVRFPEFAGLTENWEEGLDMVKPIRVNEYLRRAQLVVRSKEVVSALRARYSHLLVDNIDLMSDDAKVFLLHFVSSKGTDFWATSSLPIQGLRLPQNDMFDICFAKIWNLAFQYRSSPAIADFSGRFHVLSTKRPIPRRIPDKRCGNGSVTIAVAANKEQVIGGITAFVDSKLREGYAAREVLLVHDVDGSGDAVSRSGILERLSPQLTLSSSRKYIGDYQALYTLAFKNWNWMAAIRAGRINRYDVPLSELIRLSRYPTADGELPASTSPSWNRMLLDLKQLRDTPSVSDAFEKYFFDSTDYLRNNPSAGAAVRAYLLSLQLSARKHDMPNTVAGLQNERPLSEVDEDETRHDGIRVTTTSAAGRGATPVLVVVDANLTNLTELASLCEDHVLYCVTSANCDKTYQEARRLTAGLASAKVVDWRSSKVPVARGKDHPKKLTIEMDHSDSLLFGQCPRRVYYRNLLDSPEGLDVLPKKHSLDVGSFPASPADSALCLTCKYAEVCPIDLA